MGLLALLGLDASDAPPEPNALPPEMVTSAPHLPGYSAVRHLSLVGTTKRADIGERDIAHAYRGAMKELCANAAALGANAILNVRLSTGSVQLQGSGWIAFALLVTGDAVVVAANSAEVQGSGATEGEG